MSEIDRKEERMELKISLAAARVNAKLTQEELADKLGVNKSTVISWESGKSEPKLSQVQLISELSGIPMDFIFVPLQTN